MGLDNLLAPERTYRAALVAKSSKEPARWPQRVARMVLQLGVILGASWALLVALAYLAY